MEIQSTTDYSLFSVINGNRVISKKKVTKLECDITDGLNLLPYCPIIVYRDKDKLCIVDGQHRFEVSKLLNSPVYYVICDALNLRQIARLNSRSDKWSNRDFMKCYINLGVEDYKILEAFMSEYGIIYSAAIDLLMYGSSAKKTASMEKFRDGEFKVNFLEEAEEVVKLTKYVFGRYVFSTDRNLIQAMEQLKKVGKCDFEVLKQKIAAAPMLMDQQSSPKEYVYNIERVYNHNNQKRQIIF